jgi:hypothetical protein
VSLQRDKTSLISQQSKLTPNKKAAEAAFFLQLMPKA